MRVDTAVFRLPLLERFTNIGGNFYFRCKLMEVDGIGIYVYHNEKDESVLTPELIQHLIGVKFTFCLVAAATKDEAVQRFKSEWEGALCGTKSPALRLDDRKEIEQYPVCNKRHMNELGQFTCGRPNYELVGEDADNDMLFCGEYGMCAVDGYDVPDGDCPMKTEREC